MCAKKCKKGIENTKNISITLSSSKHMRMIPFNLQLELANKLTTISVEQLDQLTDTVGLCGTKSEHSIIAQSFV
jgi:hypothetical protein